MKSIINLYLYSSLHIAICAMCLSMSSYLLLSIPMNYHYLVFVGSGTMLIYSLHRIVGIYKVADSRHENRFELIRKFHNHLIIYAVAASIILGYSFFHLERRVQILSFVPALFAMSYVLPIFLKKNRLRDYNYLKIFLVALCWAWLCGFIPIHDSYMSQAQKWLFSIEKFVFIFAITLPFDYRDLLVDEDSGVKTLAHLFGKYIHYAILGSFVLCILLVILNSFYTTEQKITLFIGYLIIEIITRYATKKEDDYYYSGLIDGTMILFCLIVWIGMKLLQFEF